MGDLHNHFLKLPNFRALNLKETTMLGFMSTHSPPSQKKGCECGQKFPVLESCHDKSKVQVVVLWDMSNCMDLNGQILFDHIYISLSSVFGVHMAI